VTVAALVDGTSTTMFAAEVKSHTPHLLNCTVLTYAPVGGQPIPQACFFRYKTRLVHHICLVSDANFKIIEANF
jgi:hypothetical protein